jgi:hypothetical protein
MMGCATPNAVRDIEGKAYSALVPTKKDVKHSPLTAISAPMVNSITTAYAI